MLEIALGIGSFLVGMIVAWVFLRLPAPAWLVRIWRR